MPFPSSVHRVSEPTSLSDPSIAQPRAPVSRVAASLIEVPTPLPLPVLSQAANEIFPVANPSKAGPPEAKARKISKEKLKAVLAAIDSMEDEEMDEVNYDPCNTHHISSSTNPGTSSLANMSLLNPISREEVFYSEYESEFPTSTDSSYSFCSNDKYDLDNSIFFLGIF